MTRALAIDGSAGEGGGQIVRTCLGLSLLTGRPFRLDRLRAKRKKPGLLRQHLTAVRAAAQIGQADVEGAALGSSSLQFTPGRVQPGDYLFDIGSAGSTTLVLQTVLPALLTAPGPSQLVLIGGTHNSMAPPFEFLARAYLPLVGQMGPRVDATLQRHGFFPVGGGQMTVVVEPAERLSPLELLDRGPLIDRRVSALVSRLPLSIAQREVDTVCQDLAWPPECGRTESVPAAGPGNVVLIELQSRHLTEVVAGFGQRGVLAETVAGGAAEAARRYLQVDAPVGECLADQLVLLLALSGGGRFRTLPPSSHTRTNAQVIQRFLEVAIDIRPLGDDVWEISVA